jgi:hypothetical protein
MRSNKIWCLALLGCFVSNSSVLNAAAQQAATAPNPVTVIRQMCDYLKSLQQFSFRAEVTNDQVYHEGKKLQYGIDLKTFVRRPDRLLVNAEGDLVNKEFFFNGKTITLYDKTDKVYASMDVPPSIEDALDKAQKEFGLRVALTDLASPLLWEHISKRFEHSLHVGMHKVRGVRCHHLAFDRDDLEFQVWVDAGDKPLPKKIIFTLKKLEGSPQWTAYLSDWNTPVMLKESLFDFVVPPGVHKIKFVPAKQTLGTEKEQGGKP